MTNDERSEIAGLRREVHTLACELRSLQSQIAGLLDKLDAVCTDLWGEPGDDSKPGLKGRYIELRARLSTIKAGLHWGWAAIGMVVSAFIGAWFKSLLGH